MNATSDLRKSVRSAGFMPVPVDGKKPTLDGWQTKLDVSDAEIDAWEQDFPYAVNTGFLCQCAPALDIDILDQEAAVAVEQLVRERFEDLGRILVRTGRPPKRLISVPPARRPIQEERRRSDLAQRQKRKT